MPQFWRLTKILSIRHEIIMIVRKTGKKIIQIWIATEDTKAVVTTRSGVLHVSSTWAFIFFIIVLIGFLYNLRVIYRFRTVMYSLDETSGDMRNRRKTTSIVRIHQRHRHRSRRRKNIGCISRRWSESGNKCEGQRESPSTKNKHSREDQNSLDLGAQILYYQ